MFRQNLVAKLGIFSLNLLCINRIYFELLSIEVFVVWFLSWMQVWGNKKAFGEIAKGFYWSAQGLLRITLGIVLRHY